MLVFPKKDRLIYLFLLMKCNNTDICEYINQIRIKLETNDTINYHIERWETISSKYFRATETLYRYSSKVYYTSSNIKYIYNPDHMTDYYKETGISQQVRDMIFELIRSDKKKRIKDDEQYGKLAKKIMIKMKKLF